MAFAVTPRELPFPLSWCHRGGGACKKMSSLSDIVRFWGVWIRLAEILRDHDYCHLHDVNLTLVRPYICQDLTSTSLTSRPVIFMLQVINLILYLSGTHPF